MEPMTETIERNNKRVSAVITFILSVGLVFLLSAFVIKEQDPPLGELGDGMQIALGEPDAGMYDEPYQSTVTETQSAAQPVPEEGAEDAAVTQDFEETGVTATDKDNKKKTTTPTTNPTTTPTENRPQADNRFNNIDFGNSNSNSGSNNKPGNEGSPTGDPLGYSKGTFGNGNSWSLQGTGRKMSPVAIKKCDFEEELPVVMKITVDKNGNISSYAVDRKKSKATSQKNFRCAEQLLKTIRFNVGEQEKATGEITINFRFED